MANAKKPKKKTTNSNKKVTPKKTAENTKKTSPKNGKNLDSKKVAPKKQAPSQNRTTPKKQVAPKKASTNTKRVAPRNQNTRTIPARKASNKKNFKLPKRIKLESYSCIWRIYIITNSKTNEKTEKRYWIVIGDGHKWYRKFETQAEAIHYFRSLNKYAKMRVQTIRSKQFIKTVYTFFEMMWRGIEIDDIKEARRPKKQYVDIEGEDYVDEYTQFDTIEIDEHFDEEEVNKILAEKEGDNVIISETTHPLTQYISAYTNNAPKVETTEIERNPEPLTSETVYMENDKTKTLYDLVVEESKEKEIEQETLSNTSEISVQPVNEIVPEKQPEKYEETKVIEKVEKVAPINAYQDEEIGLTQYQTSLNSFNETELYDGKYSQKAKFIYWLSILVICLSLAAVVVVALLVAGKVL